MTELTVDGRPITSRPAIDLDRSPREWLLAFVASSPMVLAEQVASLVRIRDDAPPGLVGVLVADGLIEAAPRLRSQGGAYRITAAGLRTIGSELPVPAIDLRRFWQDVGAGWLSVAARRGRFGEEIERVYLQREMRAADHRAEADGALVDSGWSAAVRAKAADAAFAVWPVDRAGTAVAHFPDVTFVLPQGRVAIQLIFEVPSPSWMTAVVEAYARKQSLATTVLLVPGPALRASLMALVARCGVSDRLMVQHGLFTLL